MIQENIIKDIVCEKISGTDYYLVDVTVSGNNEILVEIDRDSGVDIDSCVELNRFIESKLNREEEDFSLEVGSSGLTSPFKILRQYQKNIGNEVEVVAKNGMKHCGVLKNANDEQFVIVETKMIRKEGDKRKKAYEEEVAFKYDEVKTTKYKINFK